MSDAREQYDIFNQIYYPFRALRDYFPELESQTPVLVLGSGEDLTIVWEDSSKKLTKTMVAGNLLMKLSQNVELVYE